MQGLYAADPGAVSALERRLFGFYAEAADYFAEAEAGIGNRFHAALAPLARELVAQRGALAVLEPGAGRTTLATWLRGLGLNVPLHVAAQDVTAINRDHLESVADEVLIGPLGSHAIEGRFDLIVTTFVYEHVAEPRRFLDACIAALRPGGALVLFSPKYTVPGYVPPSLRHLGRARRQWETLRQVGRVCASYLTRRPVFRVVAWPAVFAGRWFRDADAVHLVSPLDARLHLKGRAVAAPVRIGVLSARDWLWQVAGFHGQLFRKLPV